MSHMTGKRYGVYSLEALRERSVIEDGSDCWLWGGAMTRGYPRVWTAHPVTGIPSSVSATMAAWHLAGNWFRPDMVVYRTCGCHKCVNPAHMKCGTKAVACRFVADSDRHKGQIHRQIANKINGMKRSKLTPELIVEIRNSDEQARAMGKRLGVSESLISAYRKGKRGNAAIGASSVFGWRP